MGLDKDLVTKHAKYSNAYEQYGGTAEAGGIETHIHYDNNGKRTEVVVEHRQNENPLLELNAKRRNEEQTKNVIGAKLVAEVSLLAVERWKRLYGWDLRKANLNNADDRKMFDMLMALNPEYKTM